ncbi:hypothetical protein C5167_027781 [Papaver somniferum]|nr:hypothetical protein C5167_027781 [Papaver somniferum]
MVHVYVNDNDVGNGNLLLVTMYEKDNILLASILSIEMIARTCPAVRHVSSLMFQVLLVPLCVHDSEIVERELTVTVVVGKRVFGKFAEGLVWRVSNGVADILS